MSAHSRARRDFGLPGSAAEVPGRSARPILAEAWRRRAPERGEGEGDPSRGDEHGYSGLAVALQNEGYRVHELVTATITAVPSDAAVVLLIAPRRDLRDSAYAALDAYLDAGGRMLVMAEPGGPPGIAAFL